MDREKIIREKVIEIIEKYDWKAIGIEIQKQMVFNKIIMLDLDDFRKE